MNNYKKILPVAISLALGSSYASAVTLKLDNAGFENGMDGWNETEPAAISSDSYAGSKSLKITGSPGRVYQNVDIEPNTNYILRAYVKGAGQILVNTGNSGPGYKGAKFDVSDWTNVKLEFNSGSASSTQIGAKFTGSDDVRFDEFAMWTTSTSPTPTPSTPTPTPSTPTPTPTPSTPTPTPSSGSGWDLSEWKLSLPISKDSAFGNGGDSTAEIKPSGCSSDGSSLNDSFKNDFFDVIGSRVYFTVPLEGGSTTPNSSYVRSELRELYDWSPCDSDGDVSTTWSPAGTHTLSSSIKIEKFVTNTTPKVVVGQIHAHDIDQALVKLLWEGCDKPVRVILNERPGTDSDFSVTLGSVNCNSTWDYSVGIDDGDVVLSAGGVTKRLPFGGSDLVDDWEDETFYFKAGAYPQISKENGGEFVVSFSKIVIDHD